MLKGWTNNQRKFQVFVRIEYSKFAVFVSVAQDTILAHHPDATLKINVMNLDNWIFFDILHSMTNLIECDLSPYPLRVSTGSLLMVPIKILQILQKYRPRSCVAENLMMFSHILCYNVWTTIYMHKGLHVSKVTHQIFPNDGHCLRGLKTIFQLKFN